MGNIQDANQSITIDVNGTYEDLANAAIYELHDTTGNLSFPTNYSVDFTNLRRDAQSYLRGTGSWGPLHIRYHMRVNSPYGNSVCYDSSASLFGIAFALTSAETNSDSMDNVVQNYFRSYRGNGTSCLAPSTTCQRLWNLASPLSSACGSGALTLLKNTGAWTCPLNHTHTMVIDMGANQNEVVDFYVRSQGSQRPTNLIISLSTDNVNWTTVFTGAVVFPAYPLSLALHLHHCPPQAGEPHQGRFLKIEIPSTEDAGNALTWQAITNNWGLEPYVYTQNYPEPATGALLCTLVSKTTTPSISTVSDEDAFLPDTDYYIDLVRTDTTITETFYSDLDYSIPARDPTNNHNLVLTVTLPAGQTGANYKTYPYFLPMYSRYSTDINRTTTITGTLDNFLFL